MFVLSVYSAAAAAAGIPSAIISNFTFDSCYSYLDAPAQTYTDLEDGEDVPLKTSDLEAPVSQTVSDYQHASLLLRLPGAIPLPAFDLDVPMPSSRWVDRAKNSFTKEVEAILSRPASSIPCNTSSQTNRKVVDTPLITRRPSPNAYKPDYQRAFLTSVGVPASLQNKETKILILSFGGQNIKRPSATPTPSSSRPPSPSEPSPPAPSLAVPSKHLRPTPIRAVTDAHLYLSGAPAAETHTTPPAAPKELKDNLLPESWIALVCGLNGEASADLPRGFYACPRDVYVPDLCAMADVVLGKLGYGTCSECVTAQLPFVYGQSCLAGTDGILNVRVVPRPLFVEEWGLKRLMEQRGTVVEMDRTTFEQGNWANHILQAHEEGRKKGRKPIEDEKADEFIVKELEKWLAEQGI